MALAFRGPCYTASFLRAAYKPRLLICRAIQPVAEAEYKRAAASKFVDLFVKNGSTLGLGSGELVNLVIDTVGMRLATGRLNSVVAVPSCEVAAASAAFHGVPLTTLEQHPKIDVAFEEADQFDAAANAAVKGVQSVPQQPQLVSARQLAQRADKFVLLVDESKTVKRLRGPLPVVIDARDWEETAEELDDLFLGDAEIWRRPAFGTAPPRGGENPYISAEGHHIVDVVFEGTFKLFGEEQPYSKILEELKGVKGIVVHGLLQGVASAAVIAKKDGPQVLEF